MRAPTRDMTNVNMTEPNSQGVKSICTFESPNSGLKYLYLYPYQRLTIPANSKMNKTTVVNNHAMEFSLCCLATMSNTRELCHSNKTNWRQRKRNGSPEKYIKTRNIKKNERKKHSRRFASIYRVWKWSDWIWVNMELGKVFFCLNIFILK